MPIRGTLEGWQRGREPNPPEGLRPTVRSQVGGSMAAAPCASHKTSLLENCGSRDAAETQAVAQKEKPGPFPLPALSPLDWGVPAHPRGVLILWNVAGGRSVGGHGKRKRGLPRTPIAADWTGAARLRIVIPREFTGFSGLPQHGAKHRKKASRTPSQCSRRCAALRAETCHAHPPTRRLRTGQGLVSPTPKEYRILKSVHVECATFTPLSFLWSRPPPSSSPSSLLLPSPEFGVRGGG